MPLAAGGAELPAVSDEMVAGPGGPIPVRVYRPAVEDGLPAVVYAHGGGWVLANLELHDATCRDLAAESGAVVVSVDYRKAPEHPFPAAYDDCLAVAEHLLAGGFGVDGNRVALAGDSAGGNLSAVLAIALQEHDPAPVHQVLIYPVIAPTINTTPSYERFSDGFFMSSRDMAYFLDLYVAGADIDDPRLTPDAVDDLSGLASATVVLAEADVLVDEGKAYAERLAAAGVDVEMRVWEGQPHPFVALGAMIGNAADARSFMAERLRASFESH